MSREGASAMGSVDAVASADTKRSVWIEPSAHPRVGSGERLSAGLARSGHCPKLSVAPSGPRASNFLPPFPRDGFATHPSRRTRAASVL